MPVCLEHHFIRNVLESLTNEWVNVCKEFNGNLKRPKRTIQDCDSGTISCFGKERVMVRNELVKKVRLSTMMVLTLFGNTNAKLNVEEIVEKTKNGTVVHVASWERMKE